MKYFLITAILGEFYIFNIYFLNLKILFYLALQALDVLSECNSTYTQYYTPLRPCAFYQCKPGDIYRCSCLQVPVNPADNATAYTNECCRSSRYCDDANWNCPHINKYKEVDSCFC